MTMQRTDEELAQDQALEAAQREQKRRHEADPQHEPFFLPADYPGLETEAWTAGGPEEDDA